MPKKKLNIQTTNLCNQENESELITVSDSESQRPVENEQEIEEVDQNFTTLTRTRACKRKSLGWV
jgi:hypothetical protein